MSMTPRLVSVRSAVRVFLSSILISAGSYAAFAGPALTGSITTIAGNGTQGVSGEGGAATAAKIGSVYGVAVDTSGNVYIAEFDNHRVRKIAAGTGVITTVVGTGVSGTNGDNGLATAAQLLGPQAVAVDGSTNLYVVDGARVRKVTAATGIITTVAGTTSSGFDGDNGPATSAHLNFPLGVALDSSANLYITDTNNQRVRKVTVATGVITTIAGTGAFGFSGDNGPAISAQLNGPAGIGLDPAGNVYVADRANNRIRKVTVATGVITTFAGSGAAGYSGENGPATSAALSITGPDGNGLTVDSVGNVYFADNSNRIRKISAATGLITTVAGCGIFGDTSFGGDGGAAPAAQLWEPDAVAVDASGNLYIADSFNFRIRKVSAPVLPALLMGTVAGTGAAVFGGDNGPATAAQLSGPTGVAIDGAGNIYIADTFNSRIRKVAAGTGVITTVAGGAVSGPVGDGGPATAARLSLPQGVAVDTAGNIYIADTSQLRIRKVTVATGIITTIAGNGSSGSSGDNGPATAATLSTPIAVAVDLANNVYIADELAHRVRKVTAATGIITTIAGNGFSGFTGDNGPSTSAQLSLPQGVGVDAAGNIYIADSNNNRIRKISAATGIITTIAGSGPGGFDGENGPATAAELSSPTGVAVDAAGNVYIADHYNWRVRKVSSSTGLITTVMGSGTSGFGGDGGVASAGQMQQIVGIAVDASGNVYVADNQNNRVRIGAIPLLPPTNLTATRAGTGVSLSWTGAPGALSYIVKRGVIAGGEVPLAAGISATGFLDADVSRGQPYFYVVSAVYAAGESASNEVSITLSGAPSDFDGDGRTDVTVYRPSSGSWYTLGSSAGFSAASWGAPSDIPVPADYDGDGKTDIAVYRPDTGTWYILGSIAGFSAVAWGIAGDVPVPADYDGDGKADVAVYRPSTGSWYILRSTAGFSTASWGAPGDTPVPADYDGDGKADVAVYRPSTGSWYILGSTAGFSTVAWGIPGDMPVRGDYDGDGKADVAVYRPTTGGWYILGSTAGFSTATWGAAGDVPVPADYDGDGRTDFAVYRPSTGSWYILASTAGFSTVTWGASGDVPVASVP